ARRGEIAAIPGPSGSGTAWNFTGAKKAITPHQQFRSPRGAVWIFRPRLSSVTRAYCESDKTSRSVAGPNDDAPPDPAGALRREMIQAEQDGRLSRHERLFASRSAATTGPAGTQRRSDRHRRPGRPAVIPEESALRRLLRLVWPDQLRCGTDREKFRTSSHRYSVYSFPS